MSKVVKKKVNKTADSSNSKNNSRDKNSKGKTRTIMLSITPEKYFILCDGRQLKHYLELAEALRFMNDDIFYYHVNDQRNDFASWINDVFKEEELSKKLRNIRNRLETSVEIYKHLFEKLSRLKK